MVDDSSVMTAFGLVGDNIHGMGNKLTRIHDKLHLLFLENSENLVVTLFMIPWKRVPGLQTKKQNLKVFCK